VRSDVCRETEEAHLYDCRRDASVLQAVASAFKERRERKLDGGMAAGAARKDLKSAQQEAASGQQPAPPPAPPAPVDADDDIFADAGRDYVPAPKPAGGTTAAAQPPARGPVFGGHHSVLPPPVAGVSGTDGQAHGDGGAAVRTEKSARMARMLAGEDEDDAYGELYPMGGRHMTYGGFGADSDDEGDGTKVKGKKAKADAQDGDEEAKAKDPKQRAQHQEKKLDSQLRGVQRALEEKHGDKHRGAFGMDSKDKGQGAQGSKRDGGDAAQPAMKDRAKRLRLE
jgi:hypothetical protein